MKYAHTAAALLLAAPLLMVGAPAFAPAFAQGTTASPPAPNANNAEPQPSGSLPVAVPKKPATRHAARTKTHRAATHS